MEPVPSPATAETGGDDLDDTDLMDDDELRAMQERNARRRKR
jgi:hypothetical protein